MESQNRLLIEIALASGVSKEKIQADINQSNKQSTDRATKDLDSGKITRADYKILIDGLRN